MLEVTITVGFVLDSSCFDYLLVLADEKIKWKDCVAGFSVTNVIN